MAQTYRALSLMLSYPTAETAALMHAALEAQRMLAEEHDVAVDVWSATSYKLLREDALEVERWNRLHPTQTPRVPYVTQVLTGAEGPVVVTSDWIKSVNDMPSIHSVVSTRPVLVAVSTLGMRMNG